MDAVICSFPSSMCATFMPLNKSLIFNPAHRYNFNYCTDEKLDNLNRIYDELNEKGKLFVAGMSRYDQEYQKHYSGYM